MTIVLDITAVMITAIHIYICLCIYVYINICVYMYISGMERGEPWRLGAVRVRTGHSRVGACYGFGVLCVACLHVLDSGSCVLSCVHVWDACCLGACVLDWVLGSLLVGVSWRLLVRSWPTPGALLE